MLDVKIFAIALGFDKPVFFCKDAKNEKDRGNYYEPQVLKFVFI